MGKVSGYNHMAVVAGARGYNEAETKNAIKQGEVTAEIHIPETIATRKTDTLEITESDYVQKQSRSVEELMDLVKEKEKENYHNSAQKAVSDFIAHKTTLEQKAKNAFGMDDEKKSLVEQMKEALKEGEEKNYDPDRIAKKIARGRKCSKKELDWLEEHDPVKYRKAVAANETRKMTEARIRGIKDKEQLRKAIDMAKAAGCSGSDQDFSLLIIEGVKELEDRYIKKKKKKDGFEDDLDSPFAETQVSGAEFSSNSNDK